MNYQKQLMLEVLKIKQRVADLDKTGYKIQITFLGHADSPSVEVKYRMADNYGCDSVVGDTLEAVANEWLRRQGWQDKHEIKAIAFEGNGEQQVLAPPVDEDDDEIPV